MSNSSQSEAFWGKSTAQSPSPSATLDPRDPIAWNESQGRSVVRDPSNPHRLLETTAPPPVPRAPELPPPGLQRVQALVTRQGEQTVSARTRAAEALVMATIERDRIAAAFARDQFAQTRDALEHAQRGVTLAQATLDAAERECQRVRDLQQQASTSLQYDRLAQRDAAQADEPWPSERDDVKRDVAKVANQLADLLKQQRARADEVNQARSEARALARELELPWQPGRHDVNDRMLTLAHAFKKALADAGISAADAATLTRA